MQCLFTRINEIPTNRKTTSCERRMSIICKYIAAILAVITINIMLLFGLRSRIKWPIINKKTDYCNFLDLQ